MFEMSHSVFEGRFIRRYLPDHDIVVVLPHKYKLLLLIFI